MGICRYSTADRHRRVKPHHPSSHQDLSISQVGKRGEAVCASLTISPGGRGVDVDAWWVVRRVSTLVDDWQFQMLASE